MVLKENSATNAILENKSLKTNYSKSTRKKNKEKKDKKRQ